jgi:hypothetical protein
VTRSQHHAFTVAAAITNGSRNQGPPAAMSAPNTVSTANVTRIGPTLAHRGRTRHHCVVIALWWTTSEIKTTTGTATIQRYESENTALAKSMTTQGTRSTVRIAVDHAARRTSSRALGRATVVGHAFATSTAVIAVRATKSPASATANTNHDGTYTASHRRSWNTS